LVGFFIGLMLFCCLLRAALTLFAQAQAEARKRFEEVQQARLSATLQLFFKKKIKIGERNHTARCSQL